MPTLCNFHKSPSRAGTGQSQGSRSPGQCATYSSYSAFSGGALSRVRIFQVSWKYCDAYQIVQYDCQSRPESFEFVQDLNILAVSPPDWRRPKRTCQTWGVVCRRRQTDQLFSYKSSIFDKFVMWWTHIFYVVRRHPLLLIVLNLDYHHINLFFSTLPWRQP